MLGRCINTIIDLDFLGFFGLVLILKEIILDSKFGK